MSAQLLGNIPSVLFEVPTAQRSNAYSLVKLPRQFTSASEVLPSACPLSPKPNTYPQTSSL